MPAREAGDGTGAVFRKPSEPHETHGAIVADSVERAVRREKTTTTASAVAVVSHRRREARERGGRPAPVGVRRQRAAIATS
ncbi:hypothetical protein DN523_20800 [Burkholderia multivorans]|nr:hypothetical protein DBB31_02525 [Burkholderia multivorans]RAA28869.1 hypothetical protein DN471_09770 [Burkholderia multivorans]RAA31722.1 hypothetical protein DN470_02305 [Burkholderia multivorans]RAA38288.1 hypothetical protein DN465_03405 [Burkholderia multivorans]RAA44383.1 hypothetical protein DN500_14985 [Burkholderia multivorans]